jgi:plastocyanin
MIVVPLIALSCGQPSGTAGTRDSAANAGTPLAESAADNVFSVDSFAIVAGQPYTLTLTNTGDAVHNWHIIDARDKRGREIATDLIEGHKSTSVTFVVARPGSYAFQCDVHPDTMKGTLIVRGS